MSGGCPRAKRAAVVRAVAAALRSVRDDVTREMRRREGDAASQLVVDTRHPLEERPRARLPVPHAQRKQPLQETQAAVGVAHRDRDRQLEDEMVRSRHRDVDLRVVRRRNGQRDLYGIEQRTQRHQNTCSPEGQRAPQRVENRRGRLRRRVRTVERPRPEQAEELRAAIGNGVGLES